MEAKDTVMNWDKIVKLTGFVSDVDSHPAKRMKELAQAQAEISFKAGVREVVEWINKYYEGRCVLSSVEGQAKLKEWGCP